MQGGGPAKSAGRWAENPTRKQQMQSEGPVKSVKQQNRALQKYRTVRIPHLLVKNIVSSHQKVFGLTPFSKGVAGCRAGALQRALDVRQKIL